jgi:hypothetical protein
VAPRETSNFLELLAAQSLGILGIALAIWCTSLRTEPDEDIAKKDDAAEHEIHGQTVWVIPWNQVVLPELPGGAGRDEAFLMHTLLLHKGLPLKLLRLLIIISTLVLTINRVIDPTIENLMVLLGALGLALGFAFKDYASSFTWFPILPFAAKQCYLK